MNEPAPEQCGADPCAVSGRAAACDDHNACTADHCQPWVGCVHVAIGGKCDDGNACTLDDLCQDGVCAGGVARDCDDHDLCTIDVCKAAGGCAHTSIASLCADANPCTDERCDPHDGCVYPFNAVPCDDGNACTAVDTCTQGACLGFTVDPDDSNPCTDDVCDRDVGVVNTPNALPCSDGDACTVGDLCRAAVCRSGTAPLPCDDSNFCTADSCDPASGCVHSFTTTPCDDASACTAHDTCTGGACVGAAVACDDSNACTVDSCNPALGCRNDLVVSNACRPVITVTSPLRGATIQGTAASQAVTVSGTVQSGAGPITSLKINGLSASVNAATGAFALVITPQVGGNILVIEALDSFGTRRRVVQSFLWSTSYQKPTTPTNGIVSQGIAVWLAKDAIDDHNRALPANDLGTILELALKGFNIGALIPSPAAHNVDAGSLVGTYDIYVRNLTYNGPSVTLTPRAGGLALHVVITSGRADIQASKTCSWSFTKCWGPGSISGTLTFSSIVIDATVDLSVSNHQLVATIPSSSVNMAGVDVSINGAFGFLADFILGFFIDSFVSNIETTFNNQIRPVLGPLIADALSALAFATSVEIPGISGGGPIPVDLLTDFQSINFDPAGGRFYLRAGAYTDVKRTPYDNRGVPDRVTCNSGAAQLLTIPEQRAIELLVADDTLNSLLYAAWRGGLLEFTVPASWLSGTDLSGYGITGLQLAVTGMLAPTASDCSGGGLKAEIGDLRVKVSLNFAGQPLNADVWVSAIIGINLALVDGQISLTLNTINRVETEVDVTQEGLIGAEDAIRNLIEANLVGGLVTQLGGTALGSIPLPDIDLSGAIPGLPPGTGIKISPQVLYRESGNTIVGGKLN